MSVFGRNQDAIPLAPHLLLPLYMKEESERELAMFMDMVLLGKCDELWVFGKEASEGMCTEIAKARDTKRKSDISIVRVVKQTELWRLGQRDCKRNVKYEFCYLHSRLHRE